MAKHLTPLKFLTLLFSVLASLAASAQNEVLNPASPFWKTIGNTGTNSGTNFIGTVNNVSLRFRTNNNERMVIDSTGFIGIGKASPTERLDVVGNFRLSGAFMPNNNPGVADQLLMSGGPNNASAWSPFIIGNPTATTQIAKYYSVLSWNGNWQAGTTRTFTINDPDCTTASSIHVSFTGASALLDAVNINNVQTANGSFIISATNNNAGSLMGAISISFIAFY
jgi:hypothetical protein